MRAHSPPCKGGVAAASIKSREATEAPQTGWSVRRNVSECIFKTFAELTTPSAPFRNGIIFLVARPPLLQKEGNKLAVILNSSPGLTPGPKLWCRFAALFGGASRADFIYFALFILLIPALSLAQQRRLQMVKIHDKITIDGVLDEKAWKTAPVADNFTQQEPNEGVPMTYPTEVKVLYDDVNLYLGVIAHDPDASKAVINDLTKDFRVFDNDIVGIMIDTFRDRKNGYEFIVNPAGARYDSQMSNESDYNSNWDGVWFLRTRILDD